MIAEAHITVVPGAGLYDYAGALGLKVVVAVSLVDVQVMLTSVEAGETQEELMATLDCMAKEIGGRYKVTRTKLEILAPRPATCLYEELHLQVSLTLQEAIARAPKGCHVSQTLGKNKVLVTCREPAKFPAVRARYAPWLQGVQHEYCVADSNIGLDDQWFASQL